MHVALHLSAIVLCAARRFSSARSQRAASVGVGALRQPPSARAPVSPKRAQSRAQSLSVDSAPGEIAVPGHLYIVHKGLALYGGKVLGAGKIWGEDVRRVVCEPARPLHPVTTTTGRMRLARGRPDTCHRRVPFSAYRRQLHGATRHARPHPALTTAGTCTDTASGCACSRQMVMYNRMLQRPYSARAMNYLEVYTIGRGELLAIAQQFPISYKKIRLWAAMLALRRDIIRRARDKLVAEGCVQTGARGGSTAELGPRQGLGSPRRALVWLGRRAGLVGEARHLTGRTSRRSALL